MALSKVRSIIKKLSTKLKESENLVKLMELQHDLVGYDNLVSSGREFVREGCLQKLSRKGYQQRMFFLVGIFRKLISYYFAHFSFLTCCSTLTAPLALASSSEFTASSVWQTCRWLIRDNTAFGV